MTIGVSEICFEALFVLRSHPETCFISNIEPKQLIGLPINQSNLKKENHQRQKRRESDREGERQRWRERQREIEMERE
jgi:hypothetical protein